MAAKTPVLDPRNSVRLTSTSTRVRADGHVRKDMLSRMERNAKQNARRFFRDIRRKAEHTPVCPIHPTYTGKLAPRSKAKGCICRSIYEARKAATS